MKVALKVLGIAAACIAGLFAIAYGGLWFLFWLAERPHTIGEYEIGSGAKVELFIRADSDVGDCLYYRVERHGEELVHTTYLANHERHKDLDIKLFKSSDGSLIGLHSSEPEGEDMIVFIIVDLESGESWPRLRDDEVSYAAHVQRKWNERYSKLKMDNPTLPRPTYFGTEQDADDQAAAAVE